jgi:type I restriction enzyme S subunit
MNQSLKPLNPATLEPLNPLTLEPLKEGWRRVRLGEVCIPTENRDPRITPDLSFKYVDISSIDNRLKQIVEAKTILGKNAPSRARQVIKANDVIVATTRPNLNAVALVPEELDNEICSTGFCVLRPTELIDTLFLFAFVQTKYFIETISLQVRGMLYPAVTDNQVRSVYLPLPSLSDQHRIAAKIQELMQDIDCARTACEKQLEAAKALPAAYLREVFESEEARKWERKKLGEVVREALPGFACGKRAEEDGFIQLRMNNISTTGQLDLSAVLKVPATPKQVEKYRLIPGDVLFNNTNSVELVGKSVLFNEENGIFLYSNHLTRLRTTPEFLNPVYLTFWLQLQWYKRVFEMTCNRWIGQAAVQREKLLCFEIPIPSLPDRYRIAAELKEKMAHAENLQSSIRNQQSALNALPQAILRKAFRGEL